MPQLLSATYICILTDFVILTNDSFLSLPYRTMAMMIDLQWLSHKVIMRYFICFIYFKVCMHVFRPLSWLSLFKNYILQVHTWKQNKYSLSSYKKCLQIHIIVFWYLVWKTNLIDIFFEIEKTNRYWNMYAFKGFLNVFLVSTQSLPTFLSCTNRKIVVRYRGEIALLPFSKKRM